MIVFLRRLSRTATLPRVTVVRVPSQRSVTVKIVPRTVAEEKRPRVEAPLRVRTQAPDLPSRDAAPRGSGALATPLAAKLPPSTRSVSPLDERLRDCSTWKAPPKKSLSWMPSLLLLELVIPRATLAAVDLRPDRDLARLEPMG